MSDFFVGVLTLYDHILSALFGIPVFAAFLGGMLLFSILGLVILVKDAAGGKGRR